MPPDLVTAFELYHWGGPARLSWTELREIPEAVLEFYSEIVAAEQFVKERRGERGSGAPRARQGRGQ